MGGGAWPWTGRLCGTRRQQRRGLWRRRGLSWKAWGGRRCLSLLAHRWVHGLLSLLLVMRSGSSSGSGAGGGPGTGAAAGCPSVRCGHKAGTPTSVLELGKRRNGWGMHPPLGKQPRARAGPHQTGLWCACTAACAACAALGAGVCVGPRVRRAAAWTEGPTLCSALLASKNLGTGTGDPTRFLAPSPRWLFGTVCVASPHWIPPILVRTKEIQVKHTYCVASTGGPGVVRGRCSVAGTTVTTP